MNIVYKLEDLRTYYYSTRQVGHTVAMLEGAKNIDGVIVMAHTFNFAQQLARMCRDAVPVSFASEDLAQALLGRCAPLAIDNSAMMSLLDEALTEIGRLQSEVEALGKQAASLFCIADRAV